MLASIAMLGVSFATGVGRTPPALEVRPPEVRAAELPEPAWQARTVNVNGERELNHRGGW